VLRQEGAKALVWWWCGRFELGQKSSVERFEIPGVNRVEVMDDSALSSFLKPLHGQRLMHLVVFPAQGDPTCRSRMRDYNSAWAILGTAQERVPGLIMRIEQQHEAKSHDVKRQSFDVVILVCKWLELKPC
jgi:hypothetical protein